MKTGLPTSPGAIAAALPMPRILQSLLLVLCVLTASGVSANTGEWRLERDRDGIRIHTRAVENKGIREIRGDMQVVARLSSVVAVLTDISARSLLSDVVAEAAVVQRESSTRYQVYSVLKAPWPFSDRDMLNQCEIIQDSENFAVTISSVAVSEGAPVKEGHTRITDSRQQWRLTPSEGGKVDVELRAFTDPGGTIPASVINSMSVGSPFKTLGVLRTLSQQPKYRDASLDFIREP